MKMDKPEKYLEKGFLISMYFLNPNLGWGRGGGVILLRNSKSCNLGILEHLITFH